MRNLPDLQFLVGEPHLATLSALAFTSALAFLVTLTHVARSWDEDPRLGPLDSFFGPAEKHRPAAEAQPPDPGTRAPSLEVPVVAPDGHDDVTRDTHVPKHRGFPAPEPTLAGGS